jgi:hypothetical protein
VSAVADADVVRLYRARQTPELVEVPELSFLMLDGRGDPNTSTRFQDAVQALYAVSYGLKFGLKRTSGLDYRVSPLEGLWWSDDVNSFVNEDKSAYEWTLMIRQPPEATAELVEQAIAAAALKRKLPALGGLRFETFEEGLAAQILHLGPYSAEGPTIEKLHAFIAAHGLGFDGRRRRHHEIYLGDPRRSAPERLRTIIRQPVSACRAT